MKISLVLMMGGSGTRMGTSVPKQFIKVSGMPIFENILSMYYELGIVDYFCLVCNEKWLNLVTSLGDKYKNLIIAKGGSTRADSVKKGIEALSSVLENDDIVLIHDATHPYCDHEAVKELINILKKHEAGTLATHVWDTVYYSDSELKNVESTLNRTKIAVGASPEGYKFGFIKELYSRWSELDLAKFTSVGNMVQSGGSDLKIVWSKKINLKITYPEDLKLLQSSFCYFSEI